MNKFIGCGNITKDLEIRKTNTGKSVLEFAIACNDGVTKDGNKIVDFINIQAWEKQADTIAQYLSKGDKILIEGKIKTTSYDGQNGKVYKTFVLLDRFEFVGGKVNNTNQSQTTHNEAKNEQYTQYTNDVPTQNGTINFAPDDLPFY